MTPQQYEDDRQAYLPSSQSQSHSMSARCMMKELLPVEVDYGLQAVGYGEDCGTLLRSLHS